MKHASFNSLNDALLYLLADEPKPQPKKLVNLDAPKAPQPKGNALTDDDRMPFGKYAGRKMSDVPADYYHWLWNNGVSHSGVRGYIVVAMDALKEEKPDLIWKNQ